MTKEIQLTQGKVALVDDEDFEWLSQYKWCAAYDPKVGSYYATSSIRKTIPKKFIKMHRLIMKTPDKMVVDHINHDTLDNRKSNLRNATISQNGMNRKLGKNNKTGVKGIRIHAGRKNYTATIHKDGKDINIGTFKNLEDAKTAYKEFAKRIFGEFYCEK